MRSTSRPSSPRTGSSTSGGRPSNTLRLAGVDDALQVPALHAPHDAGLLEPHELLVRAHEAVEQDLAVALADRPRLAGETKPAVSHGIVSPCTSRDSRTTPKVTVTSSERPVAAAGTLSTSASAIVPRSPAPDQDVLPAERRAAPGTALRKPRIRRR